jgi:hypothetical protein
MTFFNVAIIRKLVLLTKEASPQDTSDSELAKQSLQSKAPIFVDLAAEIAPPVRYGSCPGSLGRQYCGKALCRREKLLQYVLFLQNFCGTKP